MFYCIIVYISKIQFLKGRENNSQRKEKPKISVYVLLKLFNCYLQILLSHVTDTVLSISCSTAFHPICSQLPISKADLRQSWNVFNLWEKKICRDVGQLSAAFTSYTLPQPVREMQIASFFALSVCK